jgi:hypothetical protein
MRASQGRSTSTIDLLNRVIRLLEAFAAVFVALYGVLFILHRIIELVSKLMA